ncbi:MULTISPECIES: TetR/AcrR family transcriptional regulator [Actinotignum]|uniref:TetR/AcrR family transcriptional regulator n=1 Tax=Actinotignum timonense TaxID=1870995 RepID=A0ABU5GH93_9ACTO|nr:MULTISPECIES: TetR/AcrR family transcriptional regulator [Actinotignum]MBS5749309.1 TetR/AcrR family transcriptional regulator [Actinotignum schaalii]MDE1558383.1 TetR/AcrR family transcriptional regulator [Actinotignum schaalii]MDE1663175.1 TetR/AcrR family transcriptional regulator [Actinotignum schaalii]MDK6372490.1 TetR/AcrR family transcriptional regulator [Actinotignum timonense]MDK6419350.1 TetR/AcrR family transcriptional regulator [Actinotignum timonense]
MAARGNSSTQERILAAALRNFSEHGYEAASLRVIAKEANVTTGALYTHFDNKQALFAALVEPCCQEFRQRHREGIMRGLALTEKSLTENPLAEKARVEESRQGGSSAGEELGSSITDWMIDYVYDHLTVFQLVLWGSAGTPYQSFVADLAEYEARLYIELGPEDTVWPAFAQVMCETGWYGFFGALRQGLNRENAKKYLGLLQNFREAGWRSVLEAPVPSGTHALG